jgi:BirA family biotin operon repressor/biotin-[acetyl-CoA-carboxylase] ligase
MDVAREQLQQATADQLPLLILADFQSAGRGRLQRPWFAPPSTALIFSLVLRPHWLPSEQATALVWLMGVALCEAIAAETALTPVLKWPNDVLLPAPTTDEDEQENAGSLTSHAGPKVAGILIESGSVLRQPPPGSDSGPASVVDWAILGCGLNISASPPADVPLRYPATNLVEAAGRPVPRLPLLRTLLVRMDHWYVALQNGEYERLFTTWRALLSTLGHEVEVQTAGGLLRGYAEDVDTSGALRLRDAAGQIHTITNEAS